jgi:hypothetical protein
MVATCKNALDFIMASLGIIIKVSQKLFYLFWGRKFIQEGSTKQTLDVPQISMAPQCNIDISFLFLYTER